MVDVELSTCQKAEHKYCLRVHFQPVIAYMHTTVVKRKPIECAPVASLLMRNVEGREGSGRDNGIDLT